MAYPSISTMHDNNDMALNANADGSTTAGLTTNDNTQIFHVQPSVVYDHQHQNVPRPTPQPFLAQPQLSEPTPAAQLNVPVKRARSEPDTFSNGTGGTGKNDRATGLQAVQYFDVATNAAESHTTQNIVLHPIDVTNDVNVMEADKKLSNEVKWEWRKKRAACCCFFFLLCVMVPWMIWSFITSALVATYALPVCVHEDRSKCNSCFE